MAINLCRYVVLICIRSALKFVSYAIKWLIYSIYKKTANGQCGDLNMATGLRSGPYIYLSGCADGRTRPNRSREFPLQGIAAASR